VRKLAEELQHLGHDPSHTLVAELLHEHKYSWQANRKTKRRNFPSGHECEVRAYQRKGVSVSAARAAGELPRPMEDGRLWRWSITLLKNAGM
jgi:hypothetical protein